MKPNQPFSGMIYPLESYYQSACATLKICHLIQVGLGVVEVATLPESEAHLKSP
jgi:hypothetical protein